jgi:muramoyltetrapeptide carboxypeptidase
MLIKPERLRVGDTVAIVAPASAPPDPQNIDRSVAAIETLGFKPRLAPNVRKRKGFLAGTDRERAADLVKMFTAPDVRAILCLRGGYGTSRLIPLLDFAVLRRNPKILIGYSDITSLHCALLTRANLMSFHGPMLNSDFVRKDFPEFTLQSFLRTLTKPSPAGSIRQGYHDKTVSVLRRGRASGRLLGGNLSLLCATIGTPFQPPFRNRLLFLEDLDEPPYRFDRMLTHLINAGLLQQVAGIAIGINRDCVDPHAATAREYRQTVEDVLAERLLPLKVPVVIGLPFGHVPLNATLPIGARATLDGLKGDLVVTEAAVR